MAKSKAPDKIKMVYKNREVIGVDPAIVKSLKLDEQDLKPKNILSKKFTSLFRLHINNYNLGSFKGFPTLESVHILNLDNNNLSGGLEHVVKMCPNVRVLSLNRNHFQHVKAFEPLLEAADLCLLVINSNPLLQQVDWKKRLVGTVDPDGEKILMVIGHSPMIPRKPKVEIESVPTGEPEVETEGMPSGEPEVVTEEMLSGEPEVVPEEMPAEKSKVEVGIGMPSGKPKVEIEGMPANKLEGEIVCILTKNLDVETEEMFTGKSEEENEGQSKGPGKKKKKKKKKKPQLPTGEEEEAGEPEEQTAGMSTKKQEGDTEGMPAGKSEEEAEGQSKGPGKKKKKKKKKKPQLPTGEVEEEADGQSENADGKKQ